MEQAFAQDRFGDLDKDLDEEDLLSANLVQNISHRQLDTSRGKSSDDLANLPEPHTRQQALRQPDADHWLEAMKDEYESLVKNNTWTVVKRPVARKVLTGRWVLKRKLAADGSIAKHKARFVVRGFEQVYGIDFDETYASVVKPPTYKLFFALQAHFGWKCHQMDVKTAFLHGDVDEEIFVKPPDGFPEETPQDVLRLRGSLYGLKQSPRQWYKKLKTYLEKNQWTVSSFDTSVFYQEGIFMHIYVDDINILGANLDTIQQCKNELSDRFEMTDLSETSFYLGMHVQNHEGTIYINQATYIQQLLTKFDLNDIHPVSTPVDTSTKLVANRGSTPSRDFHKLYQSMVGSLNYLMVISRPAIAYAAGLVARYMANPSSTHMGAVKRIFAYLKRTKSFGMMYSPNTSLPLLKAYVDSDWAGCADSSRSTSGFVFMFAGGPIAWSSRR